MTRSLPPPDLALEMLAKGTLFPGIFPGMGQIPPDVVAVNDY